MTPAVRSLVRTALSDQRLRFLAVGGWNTVFGYLAFLAVLRLISPEHPLRCLTLSYCIALPQAYLTQRSLVFRDRAPLYAALPRFALANTAIFVANLGLLPLLQRAVGDARIAQAISVVIITCASYLAHKHFSFARRA